MNNKLFAAIVVSAASVFLSVTVSAQETSPVVAQEDAAMQQTPAKAKKPGRDYHCDAISKSDSTQRFNPHWFIQLEDGASKSTYQHGTVAFLTNNIQIGAGYNFNPLLGVRVTLGYSQGVGSVPTSTYKYNYFHPYADALLNLSNLFSGYRHDRAVDVYGYLGLGAMVTTSETWTGRPHVEPYIDSPWTPAKGFFSGRGGILGRIRLTEHLCVTVDFFSASTNDKFNGKTEGHWDNNLNALVGVSYRLSPKTQTVSKATAAANAAAAAAAAALAAASDAAAKAARIAEDAEKAALAAEEAARNAAQAASIAEEAFKTNANPVTEQAAQEAVAAAQVANEAAVAARARATETRALADKAEAALAQAREASSKAYAAANAKPVRKAEALSAAKAAEEATAASNAANDAVLAAETATTVAATAAYASADKANEAAEAARQAALLAAPTSDDPDDYKFQKDIFFDLDKAYINHKAWRDIQEVRRFLRDHPDDNILLVGYASAESGGHAWNWDLSRRRVNTVRKYLIKGKIDPSRISIDFKGDTVQPFKIVEENRSVTCRVPKKK